MHFSKSIANFKNIDFHPFFMAIFKHLVFWISTKYMK